LFKFLFIYLSQIKSANKAITNDNDKNNKLLFEVLEEPDPPVPGLATHSNPDIAKLYLVYPDLHLCTHSVADDPVKV